MRRLIRPLTLLLLIALTVTACTDTSEISSKADAEQPEAPPSGDLPSPDAQSASTVGEPPVPVAPPDEGVSLPPARQPLPPVSAAGVSAQPPPDALSADEVLLPDTGRERPADDDRKAKAAAAAADPSASADPFTDCTAVTGVSQAECEALVALYDSTGGDTWDDSTNWKQNDQPCTWEGVTCSGGHVSELNLSSNNLMGNIPLELGNLSSLEYLYLGWNQLGSVIPPEMGDLSNLRGLYLEHNVLVGSIPPELGSLSNLEALWMWDNQLTGDIPPELGSLSNLQELRLSYNYLFGNIPPELGSLSNLQTLYMYHNQLLGSIPPELSDLSNLKYLDLRWNQLTGSIPPELGSLSNLEGLSLSGNLLSGSIPPELGSLSNMYWLMLENNALSGEIPPQLASLSGLTNFDLGYNTLTASEPTLIAFLGAKDPDWADTQTVPPDDLAVAGGDDYSVALSWTPILYTGDGGYYEVGYAPSPGGPYTVHGTTADKSAGGYTVDGLASWTTYYFRVRTFTPIHGDQQNDLWSGYTTAIPGMTGCAGVTEIPQAECVALVTLYDSTDGDNWDINTSWKQNDQPCTWYKVYCSGGHVAGLYLGMNNLVGSIPPELGSLSNLLDLSLSENQLSGSIPPELGSLSNLQELHLWDNQLTGSVPPELGGLSNLEYLILYENQLSSSIPPELGGLSNLHELNLSDNNLVGSIPPELGSLSNLEYLDLGWNQLSGSIPSELGNPSNLFSLELGWNQLNGSIPPELGSLSSLDFLGLADNQLSGSIPPELGDLTNLHILDLSYNDLSGSIPPELGSLSNLWDLNLYQNHLSGSIPPELGNLSSLWWLRLDNNALSGDIPPTLTNLEQVSPTLSYNMLTASDPALIAFLDDKAPGWADTQTIPPDDITVTITGMDFTSADINLAWTPIPYQDDGGYYEISVAPAPGGPYTVLHTTTDKTGSSYAIGGLAVGARYYLLVRTFTPAHGDQQNDLWSLYDYAFLVLPEFVFTQMEGVEVTFDGTTPVLTVEGFQPDGCGGQVAIEQEQVGNDVYIDIYREQNPGKVCPATTTPYSGTIRLEGTYVSGQAYAIYINDKHALDIIIP